MWIRHVLVSGGVGASDDDGLLKRLADFIGSWCKHRCTDAAMEYFKAEVMEMCHRENLYQIDLLQGSKKDVYKRQGQAPPPSALTYHDRSG